MKYEIILGEAYPLGATVRKNNIQFSYICEHNNCGVAFFDRISGKQIGKIRFPEEWVAGNIHYMNVCLKEKIDFSYCFYENDRYVTDLRGKDFVDGSCFGIPAMTMNGARLAVTVKDEQKPYVNKLIPYEESVGYCIHVRGFTKHASSKVKGKGTFLGITEKIPYFKDLGITTLEFQPIYEFTETEAIDESVHPFSEHGTVSKLNYWGYTKAYYYCPKKSYSYSKDSRKECRDMILKLHQSGLEVILQMYFTEDMNDIEILDILRYWVSEFHVDGFHLKGYVKNLSIIIEDPTLAKTKIWYYDFPEHRKEKKNYLAQYNNHFKDDMRKFLKGDEGMIKNVMFHILHHNEMENQINYMTNYDGFTLADLVTYDRKHNEVNQENNQDGADYNASWNCGFEGKTKKKTVNVLREKQLKNAFYLLFLSQGMPLFFMGDEFLNSEDGNNNPYCQDNEITWLDWRLQGKNKWFWEFTKELITFRKNHSIFRQTNSLRMMDYKGCGYPDVSFHGEIPWRPDTASYSRMVGVMYNGAYSNDTDINVNPINTSNLNRTNVNHSNIKEENSFYIAYNMHWEQHEIHLPRIHNEKWRVNQYSGESPVCKDSKEQLYIIEERSIVIFESTDLQ